MNAAQDYFSTWMKSQKEFMDGLMNSQKSAVEQWAEATKDPMSGFFAFNKDIIRGINFDAIGYKILLEMIVKVKGVSIKEIPYTFSDRTNGKSKLGTKTILEYIHAVGKLY